LGSKKPQKQRVGLVLQFIANEPHQKQRKYINALVPAYLVVLEQVFAEAKKGCPNKTKKTYFYTCKHNILRILIDRDHPFQ
jgi:hypothetical protein